MREVMSDFSSPDNVQLRSKYEKSESSMYGISSVQLKGVNDLPVEFLTRLCLYANKGFGTNRFHCSPESKPRKRFVGFNVHCCPRFFISYSDVVIICNV